GFYSGIYFALLSQPSEVSALCVFFYFPKKLNCFGLVAWLARVIDWDDHLDFDRDDIFLSLNQACPLETLSCNPHGSPLSKKWTVPNFATRLSPRWDQPALNSVPSGSDWRTSTAGFGVASGRSVIEAPCSSPATTCHSIISRSSNRSEAC